MATPSPALKTIAVASTFIVIKLKRDLGQRTLDDLWSSQLLSFRPHVFSKIIKSMYFRATWNFVSDQLFFRFNFFKVLK